MKIFFEINWKIHMDREGGSQNVHVCPQGGRGGGVKKTQKTVHMLCRWPLITNISKCRIKILKGKKVRIYSLFSNTFWLIAVSFLVFFSEICCCLTLKWDQIVGNDVSSFLNFHGWHEMVCHTRKNLASKSGHKNKLGKFNIP